MRKSLYREINRIQTVEQPLFDADKERIMHHLKKKIKSKRPIFVVLKSFSVVAACFMLLVTACAFSPALAKNIPFMQEIVQFLKQAEYPQNSIIASSHVEKYLQPAKDTTEDELQIMEVYCDGTALVLSVGLEMPDIDESILRIDPMVTVDINGEQIFPADGGAAGPLFQLLRTEEGCFVGATSLDISGLALSEDVTVTLTMTELTGVDPKLWVSDPAEPDIYEPKAYTLDNPTVPHTVSVPVDAAQSREYAVEKSVEDFIVHKIYTTPVCTYVDTESPANDSYYYTVSTEDGVELAINIFDNGDHSGIHPKYYYDPLPTGTEKVIVTVYPWVDYSSPIGTIEVPVEFGYGAPIDAYTVQHIPEEEIVYDPPRTAYTTFGPRSGEETAQLGETIITQVYRDIYMDTATGQKVYVNPDGKIEVTYSDMQVWTSPREAGLTQDDLKPETPLEREGCQFVTFNVQLKTHGIDGLRDAALMEEINSYEKKDDTTGIMWISDFAIPLAETMDPDALRNDVAYFSGHMDGVTNYYHFATNKEDSHSFTVGFYVPDEYVESGEWMIGINTGEHLAVDRSNFLGNTKYTYYDIPPATLSE